jgi:glycosyltransferase involved in cell wall biosynthesis
MAAVTEARLKILFVSHFPHYRMGGQRSMLALAENLDHSKYEPCFLVNGEGELSEYLKAKGFTCHIRKLHPMKPKYYPAIIANILWLRKLIRSEGYDILHPDFERDALLCGLATTGTKAKMVWHVRLTRPTRQDKIITKLADKIIAISKGAKERFNPLGTYILDKTEVIFNGVDTELFVPRDKSEIRRGMRVNTTKRIGIFVGQIVRHKGVFEILEAMEKLDDGYQMLFCGEFKDTETESDFRSSAATLGDRVKVIGQVENVQDYMAAADFLLLPSHEGHEGMGRVIFEAMACSCVPIASDISGVRDAVTSETGILVPEKSPELLATAIESLWQDNLICDMQKAGRKRAVEVFSIKLHAERVSYRYNNIG